MPHIITIQSKSSEELTELIQEYLNNEGNRFIIVYFGEEKFHVFEVDEDNIKYNGFRYDSGMKYYYNLE